MRTPAHEPPAATALKVLTFEAGATVFAVRAEEVSRVAPSTSKLSPGTSIVDIVGLLAVAGGKSDRRCLVILKGSGSTGASVAVTATRVREIVSMDLDKLLPLPAFLFSGGNPFLGMIPGDPAIFLLADPERVLRAAAS